MVHTAIILAGGFGTRLQSVVNDVPKPMAPINGKPFLDYQLHYLKHYGIKKVIFSLGYLAEKIQHHFKNSFNGIELVYVVEEHPLGTGGAIRLAIEQCTEEEVIVINGDSFFNLDLNSFYQLHRLHASQISLALRSVDNASRYGTIELNVHRIISFLEKNNQHQKGIINAGVYILNTKLYLSNTMASHFSIEKDFFEKQLTHLIINGFEFNGYFIDIGIPEDYSKAQHDFKEFTYR